MFCVIVLTEDTLRFRRWPTHFLTRSGMKECTGNCKPRWGSTVYSISPIPKRTPLLNWINWFPNGIEWCYIALWIIIFAYCTNNFVIDDILIFVDYKHLTFISHTTKLNFLILSAFKCFPLRPISLFEVYREIDPRRRHSLALLLFLPLRYFLGRKWTGNLLPC